MRFIVISEKEHMKLNIEEHKGSRVSTIIKPNNKFPFILIHYCDWPFENKENSNVLKIITRNFKYFITIVLLFGGGNNKDVDMTSIC